MRRKKIFPVLLLFLAGISVMAYPSITGQKNLRSSRDAIRELQTALENTDVEQQLRIAQGYNNKLRRKERVTEEEYNNTLNISQGMMGSISIPSIRVELPIYHGVSEEVLSKGVGHLPQSALPVGGSGNHTVLTGHTGYPGARLFTDLTELKVGDLFFIAILGEIHTYCIDQVKIVLPNQGEELAAIPEKDCCTLVTCTPYGVNSHRLLVRGVRLEQEEEQ